MTLPYPDNLLHLGMPAALVNELSSQITGGGSALPAVKNTAITTVGAGTLTAAAIVGGVITRSGSVAAFSDATDTAANIVAALALYVATESFFLVIRNTTAFAETLTQGTGVTISGNAVIAPNSAVTFLVTINSKTAVTMLRVETAQNLFSGAKYGTAANTTSFTATGAQVSGAANVVLDLTGTLGGGAAITLPLVTDLVAALPNAAAGMSYLLRVINDSSANFAWTVTTNTGWTLAGTMTVAQATFRDFVVTLTSLTTATLQQVGTGTTS